MSVFQSSQFISASARGQDWRAAAKALLESLEEVRDKKSAYNFGFLYITDHLVDDASSILNLFKSVLNIEHWCGAVGIGICASDQAYIDEPAISAMLCSFDEGAFHSFIQDDEEAARNQAFERWADQASPMLVLAHGDPITSEDPTPLLQNIDHLTGGFMIGGLSSSRRDHALFTHGQTLDSGLCGVAFSDKIEVASTLSQGCNPLGTYHTITQADGYTIYELDHKNAVEVFEEDLKSMALESLKDIVPTSDASAETAFARIQHMHAMFEGEIHTALPVAGSDQNDYLVRNIMGIDPEEGSMTISQSVANGERLLFIHRNENSVYEDLSAQLVDLRKRVEHDKGRFEPKGALYISCVARAFDMGGKKPSGEIDLIRDVIGDVPLTGFYAGGEICKARLYGYTGILTLFL